MKKPIFIKTINMNAIKGIFKPAFEKKLGVKKLQKVTFKANKLNDTLEMTGIGMKGISMTEVFSEPMKVSENLNYESILMRNVTKYVDDCDKWNIVYLTFDYSQGIVSTEVWYISKAGQKQYQQFNSKF